MPFFEKQNRPAPVSMPGDYRCVSVISDGNCGFAAVGYSLMRALIEHPEALNLEALQAWQRALANPTVVNERDERVQLNTSRLGPDDKRTGQAQSFCESWQRAQLAWRDGTQTATEFANTLLDLFDKAERDTLPSAMKLFMTGLSDGLRTVLDQRAKANPAIYDAFEPAYLRRERERLTTAAGLPPEAQAVHFANPELRERIAAIDATMANETHEMAQVTTEGDVLRDKNFVTQNHLGALCHTFGMAFHTNRTDTLYEPSPSGGSGDFLGHVPRDARQFNIEGNPDAPVVEVVLIGNHYEPVLAANAPDLSELAKARTASQSAATIRATDIDTEIEENPFAFDDDTSTEPSATLEETLDFTFAALNELEAEVSSRTHGDALSSTSSDSDLFSSESASSEEDDEEVESDSVRRGPPLSPPSFDFSNDEAASFDSASRTPDTSDDNDRSESESSDGSSDMDTDDDSDFDDDDDDNNWEPASDLPSPSPRSATPPPLPPRQLPPTHPTGVNLHSQPAPNGVESTQRFRSVDDQIQHYQYQQQRVAERTSSLTNTDRADVKTLKDTSTEIKLQVTFTPPAPTQRADTMLTVSARHLPTQAKTQDVTIHKDKAIWKTHLPAGPNGVIHETLADVTMLAFFHKGERIVNIAPVAKTEEDRVQIAAIMLRAAVKANLIPVMQAAYAERIYNHYQQQGRLDIWQEIMTHLNRLTVSDPAATTSAKAAEQRLLPLTPLPSRAAHAAMFPPSQAPHPPQTGLRNRPR